MTDFNQITKEVRLKVLDLIYKAQTSHIGSNFSCIDIMAVIFEKMDFNKDKFILSKGWAAASLYYFLWRKGRITEEELNSFCQPGSKFIGLAEPVCPDIPFAGGSVGMGLPAAVGFASAKKLKKEDGMVYCLLGDGDLNCGTFWESWAISNTLKLDNLIIVVDSNGLQAMGKTEEVLRVPVSGLCHNDFNGHDFEKIDKHLVPGAVNIGRTVKGKGVSFMEGNNLYHYKQLSEEEYNKAKEEIWAS